MKLRDYKKHTFRVCTKWINAPNISNTDQMLANLRRWARFTGHGAQEDYGYSYKSTANVQYLIFYCSDRMNQGRAKALLRLLDYDGALAIAKMFNRAV
jgi:hypothetical protein